MRFGVFPYTNTATLLICDNGDKFDHINQLITLSVIILNKIFIFGFRFAVKGYLS
jgi:hypothetical protein